MPSVATIPSRKFGCEIELFGLTKDQAKDAISGAGLPVTIDGRGARVSEAWKITDDGSVDHGGFEIVSPILSGEVGLAQVRKVADALAGAGGKVNASCGFHVHVDARELNYSSIINIAKRYQEFEAQIDLFMPRSRRANDFAKSMKQFFDSSNYDGIRNLRTGDKESLGRTNRYFKVNVSAYGRHGTVEFRQHSGTVDATKMANWIKFCLQFTESSIIQNASDPMPSGRGRRPMNKLASLYNEFVQRGSLSDSYIASTFGWSESSVQVQVSNLRRTRGCGIDRHRRTGRYILTSYATITQEAADAATRVTRASRRAPAAAPVATVTVDSLFRGIDPMIVAFYNERAQDLANS